MSETTAIFGRRLDDIVALAHDSKFRACFLLSSDLTKFAAMSDFKYGLFITEVLENVFLQVGQAMSRHRVLPQDRTDVVACINKNLELLSSAYKAENKSEAYRVLEDLRFDATKFQIKCINTAEPVEERAAGLDW